MTGRHVALLRGINVGRAKRIAMADLRALMGKLGYQDVRTLLNSGNVVFTVPRGAHGDAGVRIEQAIVDSIGVKSRVTVLTAIELAGVVKANPLLGIADNPSRLMVSVLADPADRGLLKPLTRQDWAPEALALGTRVSYLWCPRGILESPLATAVAKLLGERVTSRNWATITKLHALAGEAG
jgi:uncharacterized protein (DUF1697 family)